MSHCSFEVVDFTVYFSVIYQQAHVIIEECGKSVYQISRSYWLVVLGLSSHFCCCFFLLRSTLVNSILKSGYKILYASATPETFYTCHHTCTLTSVRDLALYLTMNASVYFKIDRL